MPGTFQRFFRAGPAAMTGRAPVSSRTARSQRPAPGGAAAGVHITLLGGFALLAGRQPVTVPVGSQHVLAFVALRCQAAVPRTLIAGTLWPEAPERCAGANLRSALVRLRAEGRRALEIGPAEVRLADDVEVDLHRARRTARDVLNSRNSAEGPEPDLEVVEVLSADLLPGWYDDWALTEAEDWRQLRLHALEALGQRLVAAGRYAEAVAAARAAVHADPLRESGQACLIRAHLAEGNPSEALHAFEHYSRRLRRELGLEPTPGLYRLVGSLPAGPRP